MPERMVDTPLTSAKPPGSLVGLLEAWAAHQPGAPAHTFLNESGGGDPGTLQGQTYGELRQRALLVAAHLRQHAEPGDRVLLVYPAGLEFIAAFFGCLYAGALPVPASYPKPRRPSSRLAAIAGDCGAKLALTTSQTLASQDLNGSGAPLDAIRWLASDRFDDEVSGNGASRDLSPHPATGDDLALVQYTSGSTSEPKGVMLSHANMMHNLEMIRRGFQIKFRQGTQSSATGVFWLPAYHDMGLVGSILTPLYVGAHSVLMSPTSFLQKPLRWLQAIADYGATISGAPNFAYDLCVRKTTPDERAALDLSAWRLAFCGAEPVRAATLEQFAEAFRPSGFSADAFYPCYGLAEATLLASGAEGPAAPRIKTVERSALARRRVVNANGTAQGAIAETAAEGGITGEGAAGEGAAQRLVSCGGPLLGQQIVIADPETGAPLPPGRVGEIWIHGGSVARGYWNRPEETAATFGARLDVPVEGSNGTTFLRTGDLGFLDDGALYVAGRLKDMIVIRGMNYYPHDLELTVEAAHTALRPGMGAAIAVAEGTGEDQERLVLIHEIDRAHRRADLEQVVAGIRQSIADEHQIEPAAVVLVRHAGLPLTTSGKVRRHVCREQYLAGGLKLLHEWTAPSGDTAAATSLPDGSGVDASGRMPRLELEPFSPPLSQEGIERLAGQIEGWMGRWLTARSPLPAEQIALNRPFTEFGLDSLSAVEMSQEMERVLGVVMTPTASWNHPTPARLARYVACEAGGINGHPRQGGSCAGDPPQILPPSDAASAPAPGERVEG